MIDRAFTHGEEKATKTYSRRTVEIVSALREDLEELRRDSSGDGLVCRSEVGGYLNLSNWRNRVWKPACAAAGVEANPYDGRHTYASLLIHEGRSPLAVAAAMGHSSAETTWKHYVHIFEGAKRGRRSRWRRRSLWPVCVQCASRRVGATCDSSPERRKTAPEAGSR